MTAEGWFTATDVVALIDAAGAGTSPRKLRLFMAGWCRRPWERYSQDVVPPVVEAVERLADGLETLAALDRTRARHGTTWVWGVPAALMLEPDDAQVPDRARMFCRAVAAVTPKPRRGRDAPEKAATAALFRDVVGVPGRPPGFRPGWRTSSAVPLARQMYESRDFAAMPILADALQDAGCDRPATLAHCRDPHAVHVRGCWVVDLVLGKS